MLAFSSDPQIAERQMQAIIFYLTTFGYIDGDFDASEKEFVRDYIRRLVGERVEAARPGADPALKKELVDRFTKHFHEVFEGIDRHVAELFTEAVARDEEQDAFVHAKLKLRCFEIFQGFDETSQESLMATVDELIEADGQVHPAEVKFRAELAALLEADLDVELLEDEADGGRITVADPGELTGGETHPFFDQFEYHYSRDPERIKKQLEADEQLIDRTIAILDGQREKSTGRLAGHQSVEDFAGQEPFLDGHVYVHPVKPDAHYELTVLGDLHGCYSCLKAAVMQSRFFERVAAYRADPQKAPKPLLVLLGDYIDRGMFSMNGVLRSVMQLYATAPEHIFPLRGNHEYYLEYKGQIYGGVKPAEAINTLKPHAPIEVFRHYMRLFDALPNSLLFDRFLFVHGGIPRDLLIKERWKDLSSLEDPDIRFQMMWSDPSTADVIPAELQEQSARFPFGRLQAAAFLSRIGCRAIIRGHEKVNEGFRKVYDDDQVLLGTLFSAGGEDNEDLPGSSSYRSVTPMALTLKWDAGEVSLQPWAIDYGPYNDPERNAFFKKPPEIEYVTE